MFRRKNAIGKYPSCDHLNCALMYLLANADENRIPIIEIIYAIAKADGYFYGEVKDGIRKKGFSFLFEGVDLDV